jgi:hypothetical protein
VANWGTNLWFLSGPYGLFTTNSVGFNGAGPTSAPITFVTPKRLVSVEAYNGGPGSSTVTAACTGQTTASVVLAVGQRATLVTNWGAACSSVTLGSTNGWDTNFDNLVIDDGGAPPGPTNTPTPTATSTPTPTSTPTAGPPTNTPTATPTAVPGTCPCTIWPSTAAPVNVANADNNSVELGVKFRSDVAGRITGIRFYKAATNTGTHTGSLWSSTGTLLATAIFAGESASGWQQVTFSTPVNIAADVTYVASYHAPVGRYSADQAYFTSRGIDAPPLHALQNGVDGGQGVYRYSTTTVFPINTFNATNYWVDVVFTP